MFLGLAGVLRSEYRRQKKPKGTKWLPGPTGLPVIGRIWDIPRSHAYLRFYLTNVIPQLKNLPAWLSPWKREERVRHGTEKAWFVEMHSNVKQKMKAGESVSSYMSQALDMQTDSKMSDLENAYVVGMVGLAGMCNVHLLLPNGNQGAFSNNTQVY